MPELLQLALSMGCKIDNFTLLCKLVIDGRLNCFLIENSMACLNVDGVPWVMVGRDIPQGMLYEFVD